ncbi:hypothetical protein KC19_2G027100 [Ceratodon purpureus]|uniref:Protein kinase domain-containing protein n=1 Tax=Ceratodon purpureus TaxID=3225 RepID=A0A8T0IPH0_CERPU|nr:hypothetical protein KC19_2G027100 [Ceratodon purpureus]
MPCLLLYIFTLNSMCANNIAIAPAESPQLYLKLVIKCLNQVESTSASPKFNQEQCHYLVNKFKMAVRSAQAFLDPISAWYSAFGSDQDLARTLEIFKLLFALGKEVESFIQGCCKKTWIESAILLTNVSKHISSLGFNLELCKVVFSTRENVSTAPILTVGQIASISEAETKIVEEKATLDQMRLVNDVNALIHSGKLGSKNLQLVKFVLNRLQSSSEHPGPACQVSKQPESLFKDLEQLESLGKGSFGTVHKARWFGAEVAKKVLHEPSMSDFVQEVTILDGLRHPNIVSLLGYMTDLHNCCMIMELMDGDLHSLMAKRMKQGGFSSTPFSISEALDIMLQVAEGLFFLHEKRIVHRDLKSQNILMKCVKAMEVNVTYLHAKVADFGLSKTKENSMTYSYQSQNKGTSRWMAPELIKIVNCQGELDMPLGEDQLKYPFKSDIYSFAMLCYEIMTGDIPFSTLSPKEAKSKVLSGGRPQLPDQCPDRLKALIEACWSSEPSKRPGFGDVCAELKHLKYSQLMISAWAKAPRCFTLDEIVALTNNYSKDNLLASWSNSEVYRGIMVDSGEVVAVQKLLATENIFERFKMQMLPESLPGLHYNDLVGFIGFCCERNERILVFEYMPNHAIFHEDETREGTGEETGDEITDETWDMTVITGPFSDLAWAQLSRDAEVKIESYGLYCIDDFEMDYVVAFPLQVAELVYKGAEMANSFRQECADVHGKVGKLLQVLSEAAWSKDPTENAVMLYERPTRRIMREVVMTLGKALGLMIKCKRSWTITSYSTAWDFRKVIHFLECSIKDVKWLVNISSDDRSEFAGLPPIAACDPVLALVWEQISILHVGTSEEKADAAEFLGSLAKDSERNGRIIVEEDGVAPLLKLLEKGTIPGQEAAATALCHLANHDKIVNRMMLSDTTRISIFTQILGSHSASTMVKVQVARLLADPASEDSCSTHEMDGAIRSLVALLAHHINIGKGVEVMGRLSIAAIAERSNVTQLRSSTDARGNNHLHGFNRCSSPFSSDTQVQTVAMASSLGMALPAISENSNSGRMVPEQHDCGAQRYLELDLKLGLLIEVVHTLWKLAANQVQNCTLITDTCALICFAKLIKHCGGELKYNSVMAVMEIAAVAERDSDIRRAVFKPNSPRVKDLVTQLLEEITSENGEPELQVLCCKAIGSLARIFPASAEPPIRALTSALANQASDVIQVAKEAACALSMFASDRNYLHLEHSKNIIATGAVKHLVLLALKFKHFESQLSAIELLCYLSLNVPDIEVLARENIIHVLKNAVHSNQLPHLSASDWAGRDLVNDAIAKLELYRLNTRLKARFQGKKGQRNAQGKARVLTLA